MTVNCTGAIVLAATLAVTSRLEAVLLPSYDVVALLLRSKAVVLAVRLDEGGGPTRFRVKKVYRGSMLPGEELTLDLNGYDLRPGWPGEGPKPIDPDNILFLEETRKPEIVPSGIKMLSGGTVYGFGQMSNPGGYSPHRHTPRKVNEDGEPGSIENPPEEHAVTLPMFEGELRAEIARIEAFNAALHVQDATVRAKKLFDLLGLPRPRPILLRDYDHYWLDDLETRILKAMDETAGTRLALEGLANRRTSNPYPFRKTPGEIPDRTRFLVEAADRDLAIDLREAAILTLRAAWPKPTESTIATLLRSLLQDPSQRIRRAALFMLADRIEDSDPNSAHPEDLEAILTTARTEAEPMTRVLLLEIASRWKLGNLQRELGEGKSVSLVAACEEGRVYAAWALARQLRLNIVNENITAVAVPHGGGTERRSRSVKNPRGYEDRCRSLRLDFTPPLEPGLFELHAEGRFRIEGKLPLQVMSPTIPVKVPAPTDAADPATSHAAPKR